MSWKMDARRLQDLCRGTCVCHKKPQKAMGIVLVGCPSINSNFIRNTARTFDLVLSMCGHIGILITGSGTIAATWIREARRGDRHVGCFNGSIITGSPNVWKS